MAYYSQTYAGILGSALNPVQCLKYMGPGVGDRTLAIRQEEEAHKPDQANLRV